MGNHLRTNKIDTNKEYLDEVEESLEDINKVTKDYYYSLSTDVVEKIVKATSEQVLLKIFHELSKQSPEDLEDFTKKIEGIVNSDDIREIVRSLALTGKIPQKYLTQQLKQLLDDEVFSNDPKEIILLNEIEIGLQQQELKHETQELLVKHLPQDVHSKYDLTFYNLAVSPEERELLEKQKSVEATPSKFDDYVIEFKLGVERDYEPEELVYLGKKVMHYAKLENKIVPAEVSSKLEKVLKENTAAFEHIGYDITMDSESYFSFHQVRLMGSNYNFGFFTNKPTDGEFHQIPKLEDRPILVLIHGLTQSWACWRWVIAALKDRYQILVPDMNGFGDSQELVLFHSFANYANYIGNFLKHLGVKEYDLIGHSAGGFTTQQILQSPVLQPKHAVISSSAAHLKVSFVKHSLQKFMKATSLENLYFKSLYKFTEMLEVKRGHISPVYTEEEKIRRLKKSSPRTLSELISNMLNEYNVEGKKIDTTSKCLVVYGTKDEVIPYEDTKVLVNVFKGAQGLEIPGASHSELLRSMTEKGYFETLIKFLES